MASTDQLIKKERPDLSRQVHACTCGEGSSQRISVACAMCAMCNV